jgi:hypothetical protein
MLPDKALQKLGPVGQPIDDLRRRQPVLGKLEPASVRAHVSRPAISNAILHISPARDQIQAKTNV